VARVGKAVEIDGYPDRQDLKLSLLRFVSKQAQESHWVLMLTLHPSRPSWNLLSPPKCSRDLSRIKALTFCQSTSCESEL
jgi:hypothetical protein